MRDDELAQQEENRRGWEALIKRENAAIKSAKRVAKKYAEVVENLAHLGDGNCGSVIEIILNELAAKGLYVPPGSQPKSSVYQKEVITNKLRKSVFERDAYRCQHCGAHKDLSVDHIFPESKGGTLDFSNLQTLCRPCNSKKRDK